TRKASRSASNGLSVATLGRNGRRGLPRRSVFLPIPSAIMAPKPPLRTELLLNLAFLAAAALLLGVGTIVAVQALAPDLSPGQVLSLLFATVALDAGIFIVFGGYLVRRHILRPLGRVIAVADAVAAGALPARAPPAESRGFAAPADRLNRKTQHLPSAPGP